MSCKLYSLIKLFALVTCSFVFVSCLDEEKKVDIEEVKAEIKGLEYDKKSTSSFIETATVKLTGLKMAEIDLAKAKELGKALSETTQTLIKVTAAVDELKAAQEESESGFEDYRARYRTKVRKEVVGKNLDLSATKGDGFKDVRVLSVTPVDIRIYQSSGPQSVPLSEIPKDIRELLQMSEEEAEAHRAKVKDGAKLRGERYEEWKEGLVGRKSEAAQKAIVKRLKDIQTEVEAIEDAMNSRLLKVQDLKSRSSQWLRDFSLSQSNKRRKKALSYSQMYRDNAQKLTDLNSQGHLVIAGLRSEQEDLKAMQKPRG